MCLGEVAPPAVSGEGADKHTALRAPASSKHLKSRLALFWKTDVSTKGLELSTAAQRVGTAVGDVSCAAPHAKWPALRRASGRRAFFSVVYEHTVSRRCSGDICNSRKQPTRRLGSRRRNHPLSGAPEWAAVVRWHAARGKRSRSLSVQDPLLFLRPFLLPPHGQPLSGHWFGYTAERGDAGLALCAGLILSSADASLPQPLQE